MHEPPDRRYAHDEAPLCKALCTDHQRVCQWRVGEHTQDSAGNLLHSCGYGRYGHHFYSPAVGL